MSERRRTTETTTSSNETTEAVEAAGLEGKKASLRTLRGHSFTTTVKEHHEHPAEDGINKDKSNVEVRITSASMSVDSSSEATEPKFVIEVTSNDAASNPESSARKLIPAQMHNPVRIAVMTSKAASMDLEDEDDDAASNRGKGVTFSAQDQVIMRSVSEDSSGSQPTASIPKNSIVTSEAAAASTKDPLATTDTMVPEEKRRPSAADFDMSFLTVDPERLAAIHNKKGIQRSISNRMSLRRDREKYKRMQRLASMPGDTELNEYTDSLARDPERFSRPHNADTGETILHLLAKEGKVEILENVLEDERMKRDLVKGLLYPDRLKWTPVMSATKADSGAKDIMEMFLNFLNTNFHNADEVAALMEATNKSGDTLFTLLMRDCGIGHEALHDFQKSRRILFALLAKFVKTDNLHKWFHTLVRQLLEPNSCDLTSRSMKELIDLANTIDVDFTKVLSEQDENGNNLLMDLAKNMKDDALREILTNSATSYHVTHSILLAKNVAGQTLLTLIEVNRESLSESLPLVLKREYGCHRRDLTRTELCLAEQLETSASASEIIQELHQLEPKGCCQIFLIWTTLFLTSLTPNIGLALSDIFSDAYLTVEYHTNMMNETYTVQDREECVNLSSSRPYQLKAFAACLDSRSQFFYTITFLLIPLIFYLTEFLTLRPEYEPTGLRQRIKAVLKDLTGASEEQLSWPAYFLKCLWLVWLLFITLLALALWQPVTAACKFYRDARYEASEGTTKVIRRQEKRYVDLAASRGELIEVSIEAVFEPMVQGYIIFPSIIDIITRIANSVTIADDGTLRIDFQLKGIETAQIFSIGLSMVSLAWCFSEYNSVRKNMLLDITVSPCSRIVMCSYMLLQVIARLLAFMLFTLYWGPGNFYPLMIFIVIHMILASILHIVFSEDLAYWKKGYYLKFVHNVIMNSFASIYFHNYLRFDEMPEHPEQDLTKTPKNFDPEQLSFIDSQRPGLHISTFLRQLMFDALYALEFLILLSFGLNSEVVELMDAKVKPALISVILSLSVISVFLRLFYYIVMHVWRNVILTGKKLIRQEIINDDSNTGIQQKFFKYVFISRNTWILGSLKHIETTLIVLPKRIIEAIKGRGQDLEYNFNDATRHSPLEFFQTRKINNFFISLMCFPLVIIVIVLNVAMILLLLIGLVMTIPVAVCVFLYNLKSGFRAVELDESASGNDTVDGLNTLELPPEIDSGEAAIFQCDTSKTLASFQQDLEEGGGRIDLSRHVEVTADEFDVFAMLLLSLNRKKHPLKLLILDNCDITDDKLEKLTPLLVKFEKVTLNGSQKMTAAGWEFLGQAIRSTGCKLRKLELKIAKNDDDVIRLRREILLEELKGSQMTADSLKKIAAFMPYLEKIYLDDVFNDNMFSEMLKSRSSNDLIDAWKCVTKSIMNCPIADRKLRCLSMPGCAINDDILNILSPALVKIRAVHLGRNPITVNGWEVFKNALVDEISASGGLSSLTHLSLNTLNSDKSTMGSIGSSKFLHAPAMEHLGHIILRLEEVDLSGQQEVGADGWTVMANVVLLAHDKGNFQIKLKSLKLASCKIKNETKEMLEDTFAKCHSSSRLDFGLEVDSSKRFQLCSSCW